MISMKIPIFNSIYYDDEFKHIKSKIDIKKLNNLNFSKPNLKIPFFEDFKPITK